MKLDLEKLPALKNLSEDVRQKALEYADQLGARGPRPTTVLGTAVTLATEWKSGRLPPKPAGHAAWLVQPRQSKWILRRANDADPRFTFNNREDAVRRAQALAKEDGVACLVFGPGGTLTERYEAPKPELARPAPRAFAIPEPARPAPAPVLTVVAAPAPVAEPEPEPAPEPVLLAEPAPEPVLLAEPAPEPVLRAEPAPEPEPEPEPFALPPAPITASVGSALRIKRLGAKWAIIAPGLPLETFPTKAKAQRRAKELSAETGRAIVFA